MPVHILILSAWTELRLLSTVVSLLGRAPRAGVLTVSWPMDIVASAITAGIDRMAEVIQQLDVAQDELLDDADQLVGRGEASETQAAPPQRMAFCAFLRAVYVCPQGRIASMVCTLSIHVYWYVYWYVLVYASLYLFMLVPCTGLQVTRPIRHHIVLATTPRSCCELDRCRSF
jgi:hypothetical protein